ncbi:MAG TPA: hypothetical protein VFR33_08310 [Candidatus Dormibacteraeota bacterium]|nr:hypothetical protein [Candidatus Dormibacteraeota bacterium]
MRNLLILCGLASFLAGADVLITTWSDRGVPAQTVTVCQATDVAKHPYQAATVRIATNGSLPADVDPARDVVPPYSYRGINYPGVNWSAQGRAVWYAGCQATGNAVAAVQGAPPTSVAAPPSPPPAPQPVLGLWPQAVFLQDGIRAMALGIMAIALLMIAAAGIGSPPEFEPSLVRVSSDLSRSSKPLVRPRRSGQ